MPSEPQERSADILSQRAAFSCSSKGRSGNLASPQEPVGLSVSHALSNVQPTGNSSTQQQQRETSRKANCCVEWCPAGQGLGRGNNRKEKVVAEEGRERPGIQERPNLAREGLGARKGMLPPGGCEAFTDQCGRKVMMRKSGAQGKRVGAPELRWHPGYITNPSWRPGTKLPSSSEAECQSRNSQAWRSAQTSLLYHCELQNLRLVPNLPGACFHWDHRVLIPMHQLR